MSTLFYALCALTALFCASMLIKAYYQSGYRLLLWGSLCFIGLTLNNALLMVDKLLLPDVNLLTWRLLIALFALLVLLCGIIWDAE
jgi:hypothetical protein